MMILAPAMRHSVGRPTHGNGGRHVNPMERPCPPPSDLAETYIVKDEIRTARRCGFCRKMNLTVRHKTKKVAKK